MKTDPEIETDFDRLWPPFLFDHGIEVGRQGLEGVLVNASLFRKHSEQVRMDKKVKRSRKIR